MPGRSMLRALGHRNFRLFFAGQTLSLVGTWAQSTAMPWLVTGLTTNPLTLGLVGFSAQLPSFFLPPFAGVLTDRVNRHRTLMVTQSLAMAQAFALTALVVFGRVQIWHVIAFNLALSAINAFDMTLRQTFLGDMLNDRTDLANAVALNSTIVQLARLVGPSIAAAMIATVGEAACFALNGLSFLAVLGALGAMRLPTRTREVHHGPVWRGIAEGAAYVAGSPPIRSLLLLVSCVSLFGMPYSVLLPIYVRETLGQGPYTFGLLMTAAGLGALTASLVLAWRGLRGIIGRIAIAPFAVGLCLAAFAVCDGAWAAATLLFLTGFSVMVLLNSCNTLLQCLAAEDKRGRVMSFYTMAFLGMGPLGSLVIGKSAELLGISGALRVAGALCVAGGVAFALSVPGWRSDVKAALRRLRSPAPVGTAN